MKVSKEYLKQIIKEEVDSVLEEGPMDFMRSLGGSAVRGVTGAASSAKDAIAKKAGQAGSAISGAAQRAGSAVSGAAQRAGAAVTGAVDSAKAASLKADIEKQSQQVNKEIETVFKKNIELLKRATALKDQDLMAKIQKVDYALSQAARELGIQFE